MRMLNHPHSLVLHFCGLLYNNNNNNSFFKLASPYKKKSYTRYINSASCLPSKNRVIRTVLPQRESNPCCHRERRSLKHYTMREHNAPCFHCLSSLKWFRRRWKLEKLKIENSAVDLRIGIENDTCKFQVATVHRLGVLGTDKHTHTHFVFYITDVRHVSWQIIV